MATYEIKNKVFLVTGGSSGIGAGFVRAIVEDAKHVAVFDLDATAGKVLQDEINAKYGQGKVKFYKVDVTNETQINEALDDILKEFGYIDVLLNSAGLFNDSENVFRKEIEINLGALVYLTMKLYTHMRKDRGGRGGTVINISSISALVQMNSTPIYSATKSGVLQFSNCLGKEKNYNRTGVRVVAMCFGPTDTSIFDEDKLMMFDTEIVEDLKEEMSSTSSMKIQKLESAVKGLEDAYKHGDPGSTWAQINDQSAVDYTLQVQKAYSILGAIVA